MCIRGLALGLLPYQGVYCPVYHLVNKSGVELAAAAQVKAEKLRFIKVYYREYLCQSVALVYLYTQEPEEHAYLFRELSPTCHTRGIKVDEPC